MQHTECLRRGFAHVHHPYLDEFDADSETKRVLAVALEMTERVDSSAPKESTVSEG